MKDKVPACFQKNVPATAGVLNLGSPILRMSINSPLGDLGESVDCLKLFAELFMYVYVSIFLRKEVPSFHQISQSI